MIRNIVKGFCFSIVFWLLLPFIGGAYYSFTGDHAPEQKWLDRAIDHLRVMRSSCTDLDLKDILDYTIQRYNKIGAWNVIVIPLVDNNNKTLGCNCPWAPGVTLDPDTLRLPIEESAVVLVHEALHDYWPFFGHGHITAREEKLEELSWRCRKPTPTATCESKQDAVQNGSVIFWCGGLLAKPILKHTDSDLTHAAIVLYDGKRPYVWEAVPPRVHKVPLDTYRILMEEKVRKSRHPMSWFIIQPKLPFTAKELATMKTYAESQLGRPYQLRSWWKGHEVRGVFCSEFAGDVLAASGAIKAGGVHESPGSLYHKLTD